MKDIFIRCIKTFIQGFLATLLVNFQTGNTEITKSLLIGALAGGISALMNFVVKLLEKSSGIEIPKELDEETLESEVEDE
jgi:hypothetical protein